MGQHAPEMYGSNPIVWTRFSIEPKTVLLTNDNNYSRTIIRSRTVLVSANENRPTLPSK